MERYLTPIFVYGTLRVPRAQCRFDDVRYHNHVRRFFRRSSIAVLPRMQLFDFGMFPGVFRGSGRVVGDVLWVTPKGLTTMDSIEEPYGYERQLQVILSAGKVYSAWVYMAPEALRRDLDYALVGCGDWLKRHWGCI